MTEKQKGNEPAATFRAGAVSATVWANEREKDGKKFESMSVTLKRGYKDKKGEWQDTNSYQLSDVPKAVLVLNKAYEFIATLKRKGDDE